MNNDKYLPGKILVGSALGLGAAALLISSNGTSRRHEAAGRAMVGNDRGSYGSSSTRNALIGADAGAPYRWLQDRGLVPPRQEPSLLDRLPPDYSRLGVAGGIGLLLGVLIGSHVTFHLPVRRRT